LEEQNFLYKNFYDILIVKHGLITAMVISLMIISSPSLAKNHSSNQTKIGVAMASYSNAGIQRDHFYKSIPRENIDRLTLQMLSFEVKYSGAEKIKHQIDAMRRYLGVDLARFKSQKSSELTKIGKKSLLIGFHMIVTHFTPSGCINGTCFPFPPIVYRTFNHSFEENRKLSGVVGVLPFYIGYTRSKVYVTVIGITSKGFVFDGSFSPFYELLIPCSGTSIRVYKEKNGEKEILFEYNLDMCWFGVLGGHRSEI